MTTTEDNNFTEIDFTNGLRYVPNVAYTYGDHQPVRSTYIAHDPFFFMDVDDLTLEEELLRDLDKSMSKELFSLDETGLNQELHTIYTAFDDCAENYADGLNSQIVCIEALKEELQESRYASAILQFAEEKNIQIISAPEIHTWQFITEEKTILINPQLTQIDALKGLICGLRQAWQTWHGARLDPLNLYPDQAILATRAQQADLAISLLRTAWELNLAGRHELLNHLEAMSMGDLLAAFSREAVLDFRNLHNGNAAFAAFEAWFLSDRPRTSDSSLIQSMLADYTQYGFQGEEISYLILVDLIKALGEMPYGKNYLAPYINNLLSDPLYSEVRDRSNANFLWFIKFEQSFRDMEQSLQKDEDLSENDGPNQNTSFVIEELYEPGKKQSGADVLRFPKRYSENTNSAESFEAADTAKGEVIPFDISVRPFNTRTP